MNKKLSGFTLIELMIVVAIIGVLAAISVPKFASMIEKSREGETKGNVAAIRSAVAIYYADKNGIWPDDLTNFDSYLSPIPKAKATPLGGSDAVTINLGIPVGAGTGWSYDNTEGHAWANSDATDTKGVSFTTY